MKSAPASHPPQMELDFLAPPKAENPRKCVLIPNGWWKLSFPYDGPLVAAVKQLPLPMRKYGAESRDWLVRIDGENAEQLGFAAATLNRILLEYGFEHPVELFADNLRKITEAGRLLERQRQNEAQSFAKEGTLSVLGLGGVLRPFQAAGVEYVRRVERAFIADQMGLGKTPQALAAIQLLSAFPALIVVRATLKANWRRETKKWLPARTVSAQPDGVPVDVRIVTHHELTEHATLLAMGKFKAVVLDESHDFKNHKTARTRAARMVMEKCKPRVRLCLSGTPMPNRPSELISQLTLLGQMDALGGWAYFTRHYCGAQQTRFGLDISGALHLDELNTRLRERCYIRRLKKDVLTELPDKTRDVVPVDLDNPRAYASAQRDVRQRMKALLVDAKAETERMIGEIEKMELETLVSFACLSWPSIKKGQVDQWMKDGNAQSVRTFVREVMRRREKGTEAAAAMMLLTELSLRCAEGKVAAVAEWAKDATADGRKLILFAHHQSIQVKLATMIPGAVWTRDGVRFRNSQQAVDEFQRNPDARVLVASLKGDNAGLNITAADMVGFIERDYVPATHEQAEDRAHRIGQKNAVNVYYFDAPGTIDDDLVAVLEAKTAVVTAAADGSVDSQAARRQVRDALVERLTR